MMDWIFSKFCQKWMPNRLFWILVDIRHFLVRDEGRRHVTFVNAYTNKFQCYTCNEQFNHYDGFLAFDKG